jgi:hypothetical protein
MSYRQVRASFTDRSITVYQAYSPQIADAAVGAQTFVAPFTRERMTWIKPSFLWMMYRSGWATKPGQERILAIQVTRKGFEWALAHAALSSYEPGIHDSEEQWITQKRTSPVRVQWDPDRSPTLAPLSRRAIQIGLSGEAVDLFLDQWITAISDITPLVRRVHLGAADTELPVEEVYLLPNSISTRIGASPALPGQPANLTYSLAAARFSHLPPHGDRGNELNSSRSSVGIEYSVCSSVMPSQTSILPASMCLLGC